MSWQIQDEAKLFESVKLKGKNYTWEKKSFKE